MFITFNSIGKTNLNQKYIFGLVASALLSVGLILSFIQPGTIITDGGIFSSIAFKDLKGGHLYVDAWENKPPGIFYLIEFFMIVIPDPVYAVFILSLLALSGLSLLVYTFIFQSTQSLIASLSLSFIGIAIIVFKSNCGDGLYTEIYGTICLLAALVAYKKYQLNNRISLINLSFGLLGLSFWFKEPFGLIAIATFVYLLYTSDRKRNWLYAILFFSLPSLFFIGLLFMQGSFLPFIETVIYNFSYASAESHSVSVKVKLVELYNNQYKDIAPILLGGIYFTVKALQESKYKTRIWLMLIVWASSLLFAFISPYNLGHYYIPFNTFTILFIAEAFNWNLSPPFSYKWPLVILSMYSLYRFDEHYNLNLKFNIQPYQADRIVQRLKDEKDKTLFVDFVDRGDLYIKTEKVPVTFVPVALPIHFQSDSSGLRHRKRIYSELEKFKPDYVITTFTTAYFSWFMPNSPYYENNYNKIDSILQNEDHILILWKRKGLK